MHLCTKLFFLREHLMNFLFWMRKTHYFHVFFLFCLSICLEMLDVKWRELAPSNSVSASFRKQHENSKLTNGLKKKGAPEFHRFTSTWIGLVRLFCRIMVFVRDQLMESWLVSCVAHWTKKTCRGPLGQLEIALLSNVFWKSKSQNIQTETFSLEEGGNFLNLEFHT